VAIATTVARQIRAATIAAPLPPSAVRAAPPSTPAREMPTYRALVFRATASVPASPASCSARVVIGGLKPQPAKPQGTSPITVHHTGVVPPEATPIPPRAGVASASSAKRPHQARAAP